MSLNKKIIILILVLSLTLSGVFLLPHKAKAALGVTCVSTGVGVVLIEAKSVTCTTDATKAVFDISKWTWEKFYDYLSEKLWPALRDMVAKRIMDYIVDQTVKWIQGGGKPKFITNWNGFLEDIGDIAFDSTMKKVGLANLCSPFGLQLKLAFLPVEKFSERINCSLDQFVKNIQNFYVDFSVGGWEGYVLSLEPNNNLFGSIITVQDKINQEKNKKQEASKNEGLAGSGFMGNKICKAGSGKDKELVGDVGLGESQFYKKGDNCATRGDMCMELAGDKPEKKKLCAKEIKNCMAGAKDTAAKKKGYSADAKGEYCDPKDLVDATPGSMIGKVVGEAITSDSKWAANIQSWTSALVNALINRLMSEGLSALKGSDDIRKPERYYPPEYQQMANQQKLQDDLTLINLIEPMQDEWNTLLTQKGNSFVYAREILTTLQQLQASNCTSTNGQLVTTADIDNASSTIDNLQLEMAFLQTNLDAAQSIIDQINSAQTDTEKAAASFALNNFMNIYNTIAFQTQIVSGSERDVAKQQSADLLKQLEGENVLDPITNQLVNNGLRTRLSQCRAQ